MFKYEVDKTMTAKKVKDSLKADMTELFLEFLQERFGTAEMVRTTINSPSRGKNEIAVKAATVNEDGEEYEVYVALSPVVKEWKTRPYGKGERKAFDFAEALEAFRTKYGSEED